MGRGSPGLGPLPQRQVKERTTQPCAERGLQDRRGGLRENGSLFSEPGKSAKESTVPDASGALLPCWPAVAIFAWASGPAEADSCWPSTLGSW